MTPQELKNSILQLAVQGKLVPQRPEEGSAEELLVAISAQKQSSDSRSTVRKKKNSHKDTETRSDVPADEIPFEIPASWKWVRLGEISQINGGYAFKSEKYTTSGVRVIRISDFNEKGFVDNKIVRYPYDETLSPYELKTKNILLCMTGGTVGKSLFVEKLSERMFVNQRVATIKIARFLPEYANTVILSPFTQSIIESSKNSTNDNISLDTIKNFLIPLPPLAEQKRIVAKIEDLLPLCDRYGNAYNELQALNKRVPGDLQKSLLQLAVQGKLVPQRPDEGSAEELLAAIRAQKQKLLKAGKIKKEKLLPEISDDEIPFDIPENWCFTHIGELFLHNTGKAQNALGSPNGVVRKFITTSNLYWNRFDFSKVKKMPFTEQELKRCTVCKGDLLICEGGDYGRAAVWNFDEEVCIQNHVHRLRPYKEICINYFYYIFYLYKNTGRLKGRGVGIQGLSNDALHKILIPLPPLAEQKRIVAKLEELLPLCEQLSLR